MRPVLIAWMIFVTASQAAGAERVRLDQLDLTRIASGWNSLGVNRSIAGRALKVDGRTFPYGVGVHPPSRIAVETHGTATRFHAVVGVDDEIGPESGTVEFLVYGDGRVLWKSGLIRGRNPGMPVDVDLRGVRRVELIVTSAGRYSESHQDHADWADAWFEYERKRPSTNSASRVPPSLTTSYSCGPHPSCTA